MRQWVRRFFCPKDRRRQAGKFLVISTSRHHSWRFFKNLYGDEINYHDGARSIWFCPGCRAMGYGDRLFLGKGQHTIGPVIVRMLWIGTWKGLINQVYR